MYLNVCELCDKPSLHSFLPSVAATAAVAVAAVAAAVTAVTAVAAVAAVAAAARHRTSGYSRAAYNPSQDRNCVCSKKEDQE